MILGLLVDFSGALAFQNHAGNTRDVVPDREVRDGRAVGQSKRVEAFHHLLLVAREHLTHPDPRHAVIYQHVDRHLLQGEDGTVRLLLISGHQNPGIRVQESSGEKQTKK